MRSSRAGFTLIELLITIIVMVILLALGVVALGNIQGSARDQQRADDMASIARGLEQRYNKGNPVATMPTSPASSWPDSTGRGAGYYPGIDEILHAEGASDSDFTPNQVSAGYLTRLLPGVSTALLSPPQSPDSAKLTVICASSCIGKPVGNSALLSSAFGGPTYQDRYVYEPIASDGTLCVSGNCMGYNLYYISETDKTPALGIPGLKTIRSKHQ